MTRMARIEEGQRDHGTTGPRLASTRHSRISAFVALGGDGSARRVGAACRACGRMNRCWVSISVILILCSFQDWSGSATEASLRTVLLAEQDSKGYARITLH